MAHYQKVIIDTVERKWSQLVKHMRPQRHQTTNTLTPIRAMSPRPPSSNKPVETTLATLLLSPIMQIAGNEYMPDSMHDQTAGLVACVIQCMRFGVRCGSPTKINDLIELANLAVKSYAKRCAKRRRLFIGPFITQLSTASRPE